MQHDQCFQLGTFVKKVGTDGRLLLQLDTDQPGQYINTESVFVELNKRLVPFFVSQFRLLPGASAHLRLEDIDNEEQAQLLVGADVYLPLEQLPKLEGNRFYYHEVIGFSVFDRASNRSAGVIRDVLENGPNDLFLLERDGDEILIPLADPWIISVNRERQVITMELPEGLLEVNKKDIRE